MKQTLIEENIFTSRENSSTAQTVTVTGYGSGGEGIARLEDGRVVFIPNSARGDILEIKLTEEQARNARAEILRILTPSPHRITPDCQYFPGCGGCDFRHITYEEELNAKLRRVNDALQRIGRQNIQATEILHTGQINGYRNKAVLHSDGKKLGFYRAKSHGIISIDHCMLLKDDLNNVLKSLKPGGDITLRSGRNGIEPPLEEKLDGLVFEISGFFQVNTEAALLLYRKAREYAKLAKNETLVDMYCGVGTLTLFVGRDAGRAIGVEQNSSAVKSARKNAKRNGLSNIEFINADAAKWEPELKNPDCIIVDPPRKGLSPGAINKIIELSPNRIVYISCDPATLARDMRLLKDYSASEICAIDMFPRTANVECCVLLCRSDTN